MRQTNISQTNHNCKPGLFPTWGSAFRALLVMAGCWAAMIGTILAGWKLAEVFCNAF